MAFTRFKYDDCRTKKELQQSTDPGRWIMNVPGYGDKPCYIEDPQIIIQKWGANLRTNTINVESELKGVNRTLNRDCLGINNYQNFNYKSEQVNYPKCNNLYTEQSRATNPAWWYKDLEQVDWYYLPLNPQENTCLPFQNNISTRILEKDHFVPKRECLINNLNEYNENLPSNSYSVNYDKGYNCSNSNSCQHIQK